MWSLSPSSLLFLPLLTFRIVNLLTLLLYTCKKHDKKVARKRDFNKVVFFNSSYVFVTCLSTEPCLECRHPAKGKDKQKQIRNKTLGSLKDCLGIKTGSKVTPSVVRSSQKCYFKDMFLTPYFLMLSEESDKDL